MFIVFLYAQLDALCMTSKTDRSERLRSSRPLSRDVVYNILGDDNVYTEILLRGALRVSMCVGSGRGKRKKAERSVGRDLESKKYSDIIDLPVPVFLILE